MLQLHETKKTKNSTEAVNEKPPNAPFNAVTTQRPREDILCKLPDTIFEFNSSVNAQPHYLELLNRSLVSVYLILSALLPVSLIGIQMHYHPTYPVTTQEQTPAKDPELNFLQQPKAQIH